MKTVRQHLADFHLHEGEAHVASAKLCKAMSDDHGALANHFEISNPEAASLHKSLAASHKQMADRHTDTAQFHSTACPDCQKVAGTEIEPLPAGLSKTILGEAPQRGRLVPRPGAPTLDEARSRLDPQLTRLVPEIQSE